MVSWPWKITWWQCVTPAFSRQLLAIRSLLTICHQDTGIQGRSAWLLQQSIVWCQRGSPRIFAVSRMRQHSSLLTQITLLQCSSARLSLINGACIKIKYFFRCSWALLRNHRGTPIERISFPLRLRRQISWRATRRPQQKREKKLPHCQGIDTHSCLPANILFCSRFLGISFFFCISIFLNIFIPDVFLYSIPSLQINRHKGPAKIMVTLVTDGKDPKPHAHELIGKNCQNGICSVTIKGENMTVR